MNSIISAKVARMNERVDELINEHLFYMLR